MVEEEEKGEERVLGIVTAIYVYGQLVVLQARKGPSQGFNLIVIQYALIQSRRIRCVIGIKCRLHF